MDVIIFLYLLLTGGVFGPFAGLLTGLFDRLAGLLTGLFG